MNDTRESFQQRVLAQRTAGPAKIPHFVDGEERFDGRQMVREDPSSPGVTVTEFHEAPEALVYEAVEASRRAQVEWRRTSIEERISHLARAIPFIEANIENWAVRVALEVGKPFDGAMAEGAEVLDILRYQLEYAGADGAFTDERVAVPGGPLSDSVLRPYGVFGVITPFNFPIVQAAGPVIGALLAGNGVVVKTSHQGPWSGHAVAEFCAAMDLPKGLVNVVHGEDEPGRALVRSGVDGISFTGSVAVGNSIMRDFANGVYARPVIAEMGGKNPVIVTDDADIDLAADGILFSAFDLSGQKCSALSRVLVTPGAGQKLADALKTKVADLRVGDPADPESYAGPVTDEAALSRHGQLISQARSEGFDVVTAPEPEDTDGYFAAPTIVFGVPSDHDLATIEHFVPFLTVSEVQDFDEAIAVANATDMGLTAGIYTGETGEAERFFDEIEAGCVNANVAGHATTGWWPGPQTFGGWKGSGSTGRHTLGKWYFQQFARQQARKVPASQAQLLS